MTDLNALFRASYPADHATAWETREQAGGSGRTYTGAGGPSAATFPAITCRDGFAFSAQGHFGAYCWPRDDFAADGYVTVEILIPEGEPLLKDNAPADRIDGKALYGHVPVGLVEQIIDSHGGLA